MNKHFRHILYNGITMSLIVFVFQTIGISLAYLTFPSDKLHLISPYLLNIFLPPIFLILIYTFILYRSIKVKVIISDETSENIKNSFKQKLIILPCGILCIGFMIGFITMGVCWLLVDYKLSSYAYFLSFMTFFSMLSSCGWTNIKEAKKFIINFSKNSEFEKFGIKQKNTNHMFLVISGNGGNLYYKNKPYNLSIVREYQKNKPYNDLDLNEDDFNILDMITI